jgi:hypothetical protein
VCTIGAYLLAQSDIVRQCVCVAVAIVTQLVTHPRLSRSLQVCVQAGK